MVQIQLDGWNPRAPPFFQPHGSFTRGTEAGYLFHPWGDNDLHAFAASSACASGKRWLNKTFPREGILVAQHHFHHGFVFIVRVIRHADNPQVARIEINGHGILSLLSPVLPVNCPYILYFITEFQYKVKKSQSYNFVTF